MTLLPDLADRPINWSASSSQSAGGLEDLFEKEDVSWNGLLRLKPAFLSALISDINGVCHQENNGG